MKVRKVTSECLRGCCEAEKEKVRRGRYNNNDNDNDDDDDRGGVYQCRGGQCVQVCAYVSGWG